MPDVLRCSNIVTTPFTSPSTTGRNRRSIVQPIVGAISSSIIVISTNQSSLGPARARVRGGTTQLGREKIGSKYGSGRCRCHHPPRKQRSQTSKTRTVISTATPSTAGTCPRARVGRVWFVFHRNTTTTTKTQTKSSSNYPHFDPPHRWGGGEG